jgi:cyanate permease
VYSVSSDDGFRKNIRLQTYPLSSGDVIIANGSDKHRFRWTILALLWVVYFSFGLTVASLAPLIEPISEELHIRDSLMGLLLGSWQLVYIAMAFFMGRLVDRLGTHRAILLGALLMTASLALRALAVDFTTLLLLVLLFGVGGSIISTGAPKVIASWFQGRERGLVAGMYFTAPTLGINLLLISTNSLVVPLMGSWRGSMLFFGAIAALTTVAWGLFARDAPAGDQTSTQSDQDDTYKTGLVLDFKHLLRIHNVRLLLILGLISFTLNHALANWLPTVLIEKGMTPSTAGLWASIPGFVGIAAMIMIPPLIPFGRRAIGIIILMSITSVSMLAIGLLDSTVPLGGALVASGVTRFPATSILMLMLMETKGIGIRRLGVASGLFFSVAEVGGFSGPFFLGLLRDITGNLFAGLVLMTIVAAIGAGVAAFIREDRRQTGSS